MIGYSQHLESHPEITQRNLPRSNNHSRLKVKFCGGRLIRVVEGCRLMFTSCLNPGPRRAGRNFSTCNQRLSLRYHTCTGGYAGEVFLLETVAGTPKLPNLMHNLHTTYCSVQYQEYRTQHEKYWHQQPTKAFTFLPPSAICY